MEPEIPIASAFTIANQQEAIRGISMYLQKLSSTLEVNLEKTPEKGTTSKKRPSDGKEEIPNDEEEKAFEADIIKNFKPVNSRKKVRKEFKIKNSGMEDLLTKSPAEQLLLIDDCVSKHSVTNGTVEKREYGFQIQRTPLWRSTSVGRWREKTK
jgi:hypothetical protein